MAQETPRRVEAPQGTSVLQHVNVAIVLHWQRKLARETSRRSERLTAAKAVAK